MENSLLLGNDFQINLIRKKVENLYIIQRTGILFNMFYLIFKNLKKYWYEAVLNIECFY